MNLLKATLHKLASHCDPSDFNFLATPFQVAQCHSEHRCLWEATFLKLGAPRERSGGLWAWSIVQLLYGKQAWLCLLVAE
jgi:hypothetical protein